MPVLTRNGRQRPGMALVVTPSGANADWMSLLPGRCEACGASVRWMRPAWWDSPTSSHKCNHKVAA